MKIYICTHKEFTPAVSDNRLAPLMVGAALRESDHGYQRDDEGDNISRKNPNYCELTGLYWMWKNSKEDIMGLCHYRRYFDSSADFAKMLETCDVILPRPHYTPVSLRIDYCCYHEREDYMALRNAVAKVSPDYLAAFDEVLDSNMMSPYNMFVAPRKFVDAYCSWLFSVLDEVEKNVKMSGYAYQQRIFGFMSERLMQVFVRRNNLKVKRVPVYMPGERKRGWRPWPWYAISRLRYLFTSIPLRNYGK